MEQHDRTAWLRGGTAVCEAPPPTKDRPLHLILLGAPGVGKGTQAELLSESLQCCHLSTGDLFRGMKCLRPGELTPGMEAALGYMKRGSLVPDETVLEIVAERVTCMRCTCGFLLDGFPRTVAQADALGKILEREGLAIDAVIDYEIPLEQVVARISGRRTCSNCKAVFHTTARPPHSPDICDHCGGELFQREDDRPEAVRVRLAAYHEETEPLIGYYAERGLLVTVPATGSPEAIFELTRAELDLKTTASP